MLRDKGPRYNLGFGANVTNTNLPSDATYQNGGDPEGGVLAKTLHDHPVMRFFAASAATMVAMGVAGSLIHEGGIHLAEKLTEDPGPWLTQRIGDLRKIRQTMDEWQGVTRTLADPEDPLKLFARNKDGKLVGDHVEDLTGFIFSKKEIEQARSQGLENIPAGWTFTQELQKRLVSQARRLPYELPAAYVAQRGVIDPLFGVNQKDQKVNWYNPVDVISDFATQSIKNTAQMLLPFGAAGSAGSQFKNKFLTYGDDLVSLTPRQQNIQTASLTLRTILSKVGADAADVMQRGIKFSAQSAGAFATTVQEAEGNRIGLVQYLHQARHGLNDMQATTDWNNADTIGKSKMVVNNIFFNNNGSMPPVWDALPGPFQGLGTGIKKGAQAFKQIGLAEDAYNDLLVMGKSRFIQTYQNDPDKINALRQAWGMGSSPIEELAGRIWALGKGGVTSSSFKGGQFYQGMVQNEYNEALKRKLISSGVEESTASRFVQLARVSPNDPNNPLDISQRVTLGSKDPFVGGSIDDFYSELYGKLGMFNPTAQTQLQANLRGAIQSADDIFSSPGFGKSLDKHIAAQWGYIDKTLIPQFAAQTVSTAKQPYEDFLPGNITNSRKTFLLRRAALASGMDMSSSTSDSAVMNYLNSRGFNVDPKGDIDYGQLSAYLVNKNAIAQPWTRGARNLFGFKAVTVNEALNKGLFSHNPQTEGVISDLSARVTSGDPVSQVHSQLQMRGMYQSSSGQVLDLSVLSRRSRKFFYNVANSFQIPLIHLKPFQTLGSGIRQDAMDHSILQFVPGASRQPFLGAEGEGADALLWMRKGVTGSKGRIFKVGIDGNSQVSSTQLPGLYVPMGTDAYKMVSRNARFAIRENGRVPYVGEDPQQAGIRGRLNRAFSVNTYQPDSFASWVGRFRNRQIDIDNPLVMARFLKGDVVDFKGSSYKLAEDGAIRNIATGDTLHSSGKVAKAFLDFGSSLKSENFPRRVNRLMQGDDSLRSFVGFGFGDKDFTTLAAEGPGGYVPVTSIKTNAQAEEYMKAIIEHDRKNVLPGLDKEKQAALRKAQGATLGSNLNKMNDPRWGDLSAGQMSQSGTVSTRLDKAKSDIYRYLASRNEITTTDNFSDISANFMAKMQEMRSKGLISQSQMVESQAALLSLQIHAINFDTFSRSEPRIANVKNMMKRFGDDTSKQLLGNYASGRVGLNEGGWRGGLEGYLRKKFVGASPSYQGLEYNPFGGNTVFAPTFRTALSRSPVKALRSIVGSGSWDNPETFSRAAVPMSHLVTRLNKYLGFAGLGLDENAFKSPLDLYTRGIVGKRALPIVAGLTGALTLDRTIGGFANKKDQYGDRVYSPYFLGKVGKVVAQGQMALAGILPGGMTYEQKREQLLHGEVPVRAGRWWPLGSTPWRGGRIQYFRPSWYQRMQSGYQYTDQTYGSPLKRLMFGYDFSPLRPLDPYRFEREHYHDRPYPITGEYFSGPWGPLTTGLNMTVGKFLKPQVLMHRDEATQVLGQYRGVGEFGAYLPADSSLAGSQNATASSYAVTPRNTAAVTSTAAISSSNARYANYAVAPRNTASNTTSAVIGGLNAAYASGSTGLSRTVGRSRGSYGIDTVPNTTPPSVVPGINPVGPSSLAYQSRKFEYESQQMSGIYGFVSSSLRERLGFGRADLTTNTPVLASASQAYGSTRGFWDLNLGGAGDAPLPVEGNMANLEFSEIIRRFIPNERTATNFINPIPNDLGKMYPWLPGADYFTNFHLGDPYTSIQEGEMRLPGEGYERLHQLHSDQQGKYGTLDQFKILADVAPWSSSYRRLDAQMDGMHLSATEQAAVEQTRQQVQQKAQVHDFSPYVYKYSNPIEMGMNPIKFLAAKQWESFQHSNTYFNTKFMPVRSATEDWERDNVYGSTFPQWTHPLNDFVKPLIYSASQRNAVAGAAVLGTVGAMFGATPEAKVVGSILGAAVGAGASIISSADHAATGIRFMPAERRKELALEEYSDILDYTRAMIGMNQAKANGDKQEVGRFLQMAQSTMYGADVYNPTNPNQLQNAIPKRKRPYFQALLNAPVQERQEILSTAGRLERRIYEAAWGMPVEQRPDLTDYFSQHELPDPDWEGWYPNTNMDMVKIKMGQSLGIDMSQMGYYPQQINEANLINPSYPNFTRQAHSKRDVETQLRELMYRSGVSGNVRAVRTPFPGTSLQVNLSG